MSAQSPAKQWGISVIPAPSRDPVLGSHKKDLQQPRISQQQQASVSPSHVAAIILLPRCLCNFSVCYSTELLLKCIIESGISVFVPTVAHSKIRGQRMHAPYTGGFEAGLSP